MPIIKSAKKKLRQDVKRTKRNTVYEKEYKKAIKDVKNSKKKENLISSVKKAYSKIDKAYKKKVIHKNKAARLKSLVAKFLNKK